MAWKSALLQGANFGAFLLTVIVNALSNILPLNGRTTGEISDLYLNLFTPAGYVFSIWGIVYLLLLIFVLYQMLPQQREAAFLHKISFLFVLSSVANVSWLFLWHYEQITLSIVPMFVLLVTLISIYSLVLLKNSNAKSIMMRANNDKGKALILPLIERRTCKPSFRSSARRKKGVYGENREISPEWVRFKSGHW